MVTAIACGSPAEPGLPDPGPDVQGVYLLLEYYGRQLPTGLGYTDISILTILADTLRVSSRYAGADSGRVERVMVSRDQFGVERHSLARGVYRQQGFVAERGLVVRRYQRLGDLTAASGR